MITNRFIIWIFFYRDTKVKKEKVQSCCCHHVLTLLSSVPPFDLNLFPASGFQFYTFWGDIGNFFIHWGVKNNQAKKKKLEKKKEKCAEDNCPFARVGVYLTVNAGENVWRFFSTRGHLYSIDTVRRAWNLSSCYMLKLRFRKMLVILKALIWVSYAIARFIRFATKPNYHYFIVFSMVIGLHSFTFILYSYIMHSLLF